MRHDPLISDKHRQLYQQHYAARPAPVEVRKHAWHDYIQNLVREIGAVDLLDYGSGPDRALQKHIEDCRVRSYDPAVRGSSGRRFSKYDLVVCSHTLEHAEPERVPDIIAELRGLAGKALFIVVSLKPSTKVLSDGTPWHTCVRPADWWSNQLQDAWPIEEPARRPDEYAALSRCSG